MLLSAAVCVPYILTPSPVICIKSHHVWHSSAVWLPVPACWAPVSVHGTVL
jgi:hypothetical protein